MHRWQEDPTMDAPDGHAWMRPAPEDCPNCPCHTTRVCEAELWPQATRPTTPDGSPLAEPCPCWDAAEQHTEQRIVTITIAGDQSGHPTAARYELAIAGGRILFTEAVFLAVRDDHKQLHEPVRMLLFPARDTTPADEIVTDNTGARWVQNLDVSYAGRPVRITGWWASS